MTEIPRKFATLSITYVKYAETRTPDGIRQDVSQVLVAVADDGTAWISGIVLNGKVVSDWLPVKHLPPRVEPDA